MSTRLQLRWVAAAVFACVGAVLVVYELTSSSKTDAFSKARPAPSAPKEMPRKEKIADTSVEQPRPKPIEEKPKPAETVDAANQKFRQRILDPKGGLLFLKQTMKMQDNELWCLYKMLKLTPDERDKMRSLLAEKHTSSVDISLNAALKADEKAALVRSLNSDIDSEIAQLLGASRYETYRTAQAENAQYQDLKAIQTAIESDGNFLTPDQSAVVFRSLISTKQFYDAEHGNPAQTMAMLRSELPPSIVASIERVLAEKAQMRDLRDTIKSHP